MAEQEFEGESKKQPEETDGERMLRRLGRPDANDEPGVDGEEQNQQDRGDLIGLELAGMLSNPGFPQSAVGKRDEQHREPEPQVLPHKSSLTFAAGLKGRLRSQRGSTACPGRPAGLPGRGTRERRWDATRKG